MSCRPAILFSSVIPIVSLAALLLGIALKHHNPLDGSAIPRSTGKPTKSAVGRNASTPDAPDLRLSWLGIGQTRRDDSMHLLVENMSMEPVLVETSVWLQVDALNLQHHLPVEVLSQAGWSEHTFSLGEILGSNGLHLRDLRFSGSAHASADIASADTGIRMRGDTSEFVFFHPNGLGISIYDREVRMSSFNSGDFRRLSQRSTDLAFDEVEDSVIQAQWTPVVAPLVRP